MGVQKYTELKVKGTSKISITESIWEGIMKIKIEIRNKSRSLVSLSFIAVIITVVLFSSGCAEQGDSSPESDEQVVNSDGISIENLTNIEWQWIGFQQSSSPENRTVVPDPENYTLAFFSDNTYYVKADCNSGGGNYILEGDSLSLDPPVMTLIACGPESLDSQYLSLLSNVSSATLENEQLVLHSGNTDQRMFFISGGRTEQTI